MTVPAILDRIADIVLRYRPKPESEKGKARAKKKRKASRSREPRISPCCGKPGRWEAGGHWRCGQCGQRFAG